MKTRISLLLTIILLGAFSANASVILPVPQDRGAVYSFFAKVAHCTWHVSCYHALGSTITTIAGTDTLSASRSVINTNFSNLNTDKYEAGSFGTTLSIGTLTVGSLTSTTTATSTYSGGIQVTRLKTTATSTFTNGIVIEGGCLFFNSNCVQGLVNQVTNSDGTLTISPTTGNIVASLTLSAQNIWTGASTTFVGGVTIGNATSTNGTTTSLYISGLCSGCHDQDISVHAASTTASQGGSSVIQQIIGGTEQFDTSNNHNSTTGTFTAPIAGKYLAYVQIDGTDCTAANRVFSVMIWVNGTGVATSTTNCQTIGSVMASITDLLNLSVNDTVKFYFQMAGANMTFNNGTGKTFYWIRNR